MTERGERRKPSTQGHKREGTAAPSTIARERPGEPLRQHADTRMLAPHIHPTPHPRPQTQEALMSEDEKTHP